MKLIVSTNYGEGDTENAVLIGEWCKTKCWKGDGSILDVESKINEYDDYNIQNAMYQSILIQLTHDLNEYHSKSFSRREWEIIVGPWLIMFIGRVHRRYQELCIAKSENPFLNLTLEKHDWKKFIPSDINQFRTFYNSSNWMEYIYNEINNNFSIYKTNYVFSHSKPAFITTPQFVRIKKKQRIKNLLKNCASLMVNQRRSIFLSGSKFNIKDQLHLSIKLKKCIFGISPLYHPSSRPCKPDLKFRKKNRNGIFASQLESFMLELVYKNIPFSYLEELKNIDLFVDKYYPRYVKRIITSVNQFENEAFKLFCARMVCNGSKFDIIQHGGSYGVAKWNYAEDFDLRVSDRFFSTGWKTSQTTKIVPMPSPFLNNRHSVISNKNGKVLVPVNLHTRYKSGLHAILPKFKDYYKYLNDQQKIFQLVSRNVQDQLEIRVKSISNDKYHIFKKELIDKIATERRRPFLKHLERSRLLLCLNNSTTILEAINYNFPTLIYLDRQGWPVRGEVQDVFYELQRAGILFDDVNKVANALNNIFFNVEDWWYHPIRQSAVNTFRNRLLFENERYVDVWKTELSD